MKKVLLDEIVEAKQKHELYIIEEIFLSPNPWFWSGVHPLHSEKPFGEEIFEGIQER